MIQSVYDFCLLYKDDSLSNVVNIKIDDTLLLTNKLFVTQEDEVIKETMIMITNRKKLISKNSLKFNEIRIQSLDSNNQQLDSNKVIYFKQKTHDENIQLIQSIESNTTRARKKIRIKLILSEQYISQRARNACFTAICHSETTFDLFRVVQSTEIISDDII
jgi:hypothetical protein